MILFSLAVNKSVCVIEARGIIKRLDVRCSGDEDFHSRRVQKRVRQKATLRVCSATAQSNRALRGASSLDRRQRGAKRVFFVLRYPNKSHLNKQIRPVMIRVDCVDLLYTTVMLQCDFDDTIDQLRLC